MVTFERLCFSAIAALFIHSTCIHVNVPDRRLISYNFSSEGFLIFLQVKSKLRQYLCLFLFMILHLVQS